MMDPKVKSVCLLCLKRFGGGEKTPVDKNAEEAEATENDTGLPYQHNKNMSILETCLVLGLGRGSSDKDNSGGADDEHRGHQQQQSDLYSRFLLVTGRYLKVAASESLLLLEKQRKSATGKNVEAFCEQCKVLVGNICDLYAELQVVKMRLLGRVEELENVTRQSVKSVSLKLARVLIKAAAQQLNINSIRRLELFRKSIVLNCRRKMKPSIPQVLVPRGLFPEQWMFTYSATKLALMRLILVFALAAPPIKQEEKPVKTEKSSPRKNDSAKGKDDTAHCTDEGNKPKRKVAKLDLQKDANLVGIQNEEAGNSSDIDDANSGNDPETGGCDEDNDSDWSVGAAPSPAASSESEDEPIHSFASKVVDPKFNHVPRSLQNCRPQRLAVGLVKVICEEDENENGSSDNLNFQKIMEYQLKQCPTIDPDDPSLQCKLCNESYPCRDKIRLHLRRIHKIEKVFHCNICALQFRTTHEVRFHKRRVHPEHVKRLTCPKCPGLRFLSARNLSRHLNAIHNSYLEHVCSICGYKAKSSTALMLHASKIHGRSHGRPKLHISKKKKQKAKKERKSKKIQKKKQFVKWKTDKYANVPCEICQKPCESGPSLRKHLNLEHEQGLEEDQNAACSLCFMKFAHKQTLELHIAISHSRRYKFVCDAESCNEYFFFQEELNRHLENVHLQKKTEMEISDGASNTEVQAVGGEVTKVDSILYCDTCNCGFVNADALELHQISHTKCDDNKLYCCPNCDEKDLWLPKLVEHFNVVHGKLLKIYKCLECPAKYPVMVSLRSHTVNHHKESRTYNKTHKQTNGNESIGSRRKYTTDFNQRCSHCPQRKFRNAAGLASHLSVHHHMCTICHYQAKCRKDLNLHKADKHKKVETEKLEKEKVKAEEKQSSKIHAKHVLPKSVKERLNGRDNLNVDIYTSVPCQVCQIICGSGPSLRKHLNAEHEQISENDKPIACAICCMRFAHEQTHELHFIVAHLRMYKFVCDVEWCDAHFVNRPDLNAHLESVHLQKAEEGETKDKVKSISYCKTCNWGFTNPYVLELHELRHSIGCYDPCPVCKVKKECKSSVVDHYNVVHGQKVKLYKCWECPAKAYHQSGMQKHVRNHNKTRNNSTHLEDTPNGKMLINLQSEKGDTGFVCRDCGEAYPDISKFRFHKLKHYPTAGYLACVEEGCERAYSGLYLLRKHRISEHNTDHYVCPENGCGKAFSSYWKYWNHKHQHVPSNHEAKQYFPCKEKGCGKIFNSRKNMQDHWSRIHKRGERVKNCLCSVCGQSFFENSTRKAHERDMHGPPRFQCDVCQKKFKKKQHLQNHRRRHDPDDAQVINCVCAECGKAYKTERGLELHVASRHTPYEKKRFACPECPYRTHIPMLLRMHLKVCLRNKGIPYDEKKWGKLPAAATKYTGPPRKPGRKPGWNKRKREESSEEEEMEEKSTTEDEDSDNNDEEKVEEKADATMGSGTALSGGGDAVRENSLSSSINPTELRLSSHQASPLPQSFGNASADSHPDWQNAHSTEAASSSNNGVPGAQWQ